MRRSSKGIGLWSALGFGIELRSFRKGSSGDARPHVRLIVTARPYEVWLTSEPRASKDRARHELDRIMSVFAGKFTFDERELRRRLSRRIGSYRWLPESPGSGSGMQDVADVFLDDY